MAEEAKRLYLGVWILIGALLPMTTNAQSASHFFVAMPAQLLPSLDAGKRQDMIDYFESGRSDKVRNDFGGLSYLTMLSPSYLQLTTSEQGTMQLKVITRPDSSVAIAVIHTVCAPVCDSRIAFYDAMWKPLPTKHFIALPTAKSWLLNPKKQIPKQQQPDAWYYTLTANDKEDLIQAQLSLDAYLDTKRWQAIAPLLKERIPCPIQVK